MTSSQRQSFLDRLFPQMARKYAESQGHGYLGTIRKLPPPPLPGERIESTRYYLNALTEGGRATRLIEFPPALYSAVRRAEAWVETGRGGKPSVAGIAVVGRPRAKRKN